MPKATIDVMRRIVRDHQAEAVCQVCGASSWEWAFLNEHDEDDAKCPECGKHALVLVDAFTASAVVQVHDALNEKNQAKFAALPVARMAEVTWKLVG